MANSLRFNWGMGIDLGGPLRLFVILILMVVIFGPAIWLVSKLLEKSGADTNKDSTTIWTLILGVCLTFIVAIVGQGQGWWGK